MTPWHCIVVVPLYVWPVAAVTCMPCGVLHTVIGSAAPCFLLFDQAFNAGREVFDAGSVLGCCPNSEEALLVWHVGLQDLAWGKPGSQAHLSPSHCSVQHYWEGLGQSLTYRQYSAVATCRLQLYWCDAAGGLPLK